MERSSFLAIQAYEIVDTMILKNIKPDKVLQHILYSYSRKLNKMEMFEARFGKVYSHTATMFALETSRTQNEQINANNSSHLYAFPESFFFYFTC
jgi:hypothetical protein